MNPSRQACFCAVALSISSNASFRVEIPHSQACFFVRGGGKDVEKAIADALAHGFPLVAALITHLGGPDKEHPLGGIGSAAEASIVLWLVDCAREER